MKTLPPSGIEMRPVPALSVKLRVVPETVPFVHTMLVVLPGAWALALGASARTASATHERQEARVPERAHAKNSLAALCTGSVP